MPEALATALAAALGIYLAVGIPFGIWFATTREGTRGFRILIFPASAALWPILLGKARR